MLYSTSEFESLYADCFPPSMRLAVSLLHDEDEARDVVQEIFAKLWESDVRIANPKAFIIRAVRNASLNRINSLDTRERIHRRLSLDEPPDDFDPGPRSEEVNSAIGLLLTPREKEIVERIYSDGMSYKEAAASLGISVAAINKNLVGALKKLRIHFKTARK